MKVAYFGFDLFYDCLEQVYTSDNEIIKIFTCPVDGVYEFSDKVRSFAKTHNIDITDKKVTKDDVIQLVNDGCELLFSAAYYYKIPILEGIIGVNIHPAILPIGRGPWPQPVALLKGLDKTGVTLHKLAESFDAGDIILCKTFDITSTDNLETLTEKYSTCAKSVVCDFFEDPASLLENSKPQSGGEYWKEPTLEDMSFSLDDTFEKIDRVTRAFYGFGCYMTRNDKSIRVLKALCVNDLADVKDEREDAFKINDGWLVVLKYS